MAYQRIFDPGQPTIAARGTSRADRAPGKAYRFNERLILDVNVALATGRPLLVRGASGNGKSSLAKAVAEHMGRGMHRITVTSRTRSEDLLWEVDLVRRLHDAQAGGLEGDMGPYVRPGVLWWAFDPMGATRQENRFRERAGLDALDVPATAQPGVVLLDEIDKAEPDVPNNLLVPLGSLEFEVAPTGENVVAQGVPLIVVTTNEERELPPAFLRRCVETRIEPLAAAHLAEIAQLHVPGADAGVVADAAALAEELTASVAEFLDLVRAVGELGISQGDADWQDVKRAVLARRLEGGTAH